MTTQQTTATDNSQRNQRGKGIVLGWFRLLLYPVHGQSHGQFCGGVQALSPASRALEQEHVAKDFITVHPLQHARLTQLPGIIWLPSTCSDPVRGRIFFAGLALFGAMFSYLDHFSDSSILEVLAKPAHFSAPNASLFPNNQGEHSGQHSGFALNEKRKILSQNASTSASKPDVPQQSIDSARVVCTVRECVRVSEGE